MRFVVVEESREHSPVSWAGRQIVIGRRADADLRLAEPASSGIHAKIFAGTDGIRIRDLGSLNGTRVNGQRIVESLLRDGDRISIGRVTIRVSDSPSTKASDDSTEAVPATSSPQRVPQPGTMQTRRARTTSPRHEGAESEEWGDVIRRNR